MDLVVFPFATFTRLHLKKKTALHSKLLSLKLHRVRPTCIQVLSQQTCNIVSSLLARRGERNSASCSLGVHLAKRFCFLCSNKKTYISLHVHSKDKEQKSLLANDQQPQKALHPPSSTKKEVKLLVINKHR